MWRSLVVLGLFPAPALAGAFVESQLPLTQTFAYDWTSVGITGQTTFTLHDGVTLFSPGAGPFGGERRIACGMFDICVTEGTFETGNSGEGVFTVDVAVDTSSCATDSTATAPFADGWYWIALFAGVSLTPTRCTIDQTLTLTYTGTGAVYTGTAELGTAVFWRGSRGGTYIGTVPTLTDQVFMGGTFSGSLSGPATGTFSEL